ncbi:MAG: type II toxin-antitoxin system VapC family toxin [Pyrinomonadaceae bacterium]
MIRQVIGDTSAIVSVLRQNERYHDWAVDVLRSVPKPIVTCEAVITESCFLLGGHRSGEKAVLDRIAEGIIQIDFSLSAQIDRVIELMSKYGDMPMSLADACLVRMSELMEMSAVFTHDTDFLVYRKNGRQKIPLLIPE